MKRRLIALTLTLLAGCTHFTLVENERYEIGALYSVQPQTAWSSNKSAGTERWTIDGYALQTIYFFDAIEDGDALLPVRGDKKLPVFRSTMTASEVQELLVDTWASNGAARVTAGELRPERFGTLPGFGFEVSYLNASGLESRGLARGTIHEDRLYLIVYAGATAHYFPKYRALVEQLFASIESQKKG